MNRKTSNTLFKIVIYIMIFAMLSSVLLMTATYVIQ